MVLLPQHLSSRAVGLHLEDNPRVLASYWFDAPASWLISPPRGIRNGGTRPNRICDLPHALTPLQSFTHSRGALRHQTLTRFLVPTTLPIREDSPLPSFTYPGQVASTHLPCASTLSTLHRLPGVLSTRCVRGTSPSELDQTKIAVASQPDFPSCDWHTRAA